MPADPEIGKKLLDLTVFFALLGSAGVKAARRTLVKLTPGGKVYLSISNDSDKIRYTNGATGKSLMASLLHQRT